MMRGLVGFLVNTIFVPLLSVIDSKITYVRRGSEWPGSLVQVHSLLVDNIKKYIFGNREQFL